MKKHFTIFLIDGTVIDGVLITGLLAQSRYNNLFKLYLKIERIIKFKKV